MKSDEFFTKMMQKSVHTWLQNTEKILWPNGRRFWEVQIVTFLAVLGLQNRNLHAFLALSHQEKVPRKSGANCRVWTKWFFFETHYWPKPRRCGASAENGDLLCDEFEPLTSLPRNQCGYRGCKARGDEHVAVRFSCLRCHRRFCWQHSAIHWRSKTEFVPKGYHNAGYGGNTRSEIYDSDSDEESSQDEFSDWDKLW